VNTTTFVDVESCTTVLLLSAVFWCSAFR